MTIQNATQGKEPRVWTYAEAVANAEEVLRLVVSGEPQQIARPDGVKLTVQSQEAEEEKPFVSGMSVYANFPKDAELVIERITDVARDIEL